MTKINGIAVFITLICTAGCSVEEPFRDPMVYGEPLAEMTPAEIHDVVAQSQRYDGQTILVEGVTGSVCQNRGCWMYITDGQEKIRVNFKDYGFFVPKGSEEKRVKAQGIVTSQHVSKETLQHWAEEESGGDPSSIQNDSTIVMLTASGVVIEEGEELSPDQKELMSGHE